MLQSAAAAAAATACVILLVLVKRRSSARALLQQKRRSASASVGLSLMNDDDVITAVLGQLQQQHGVKAFTAAACVNRQFARLAALDLFWRELCARCWEVYPDAAQYRAEAAAQIAAAKARAAAAEAPLPSGGAASWRHAYFQREVRVRVGVRV